MIDFSCEKRYRKIKTIRIRGTQMLSHRNNETHFDLVDEIANNRTNFRIKTGHTLIHGGYYE
jgi:hypothetical protein